MGRESPQGFSALVALGFVAGAWVSHPNVGSAARPAENRKVMQVLPRWRLTLLLLSVGVLGGLGLLLLRLGVGIWPLVLVLLAGNAILLAAQLQWFVWWRRVLAPGFAGQEEG